MELFDKRGIGKPAVGCKHMTGQLYVDCALMRDAMNCNGAGDVGMTATRKCIREEFHQLYGSVDYFCR